MPEVILLEKKRINLKTKINKKNRKFLSGFLINFKVIFSIGL
jgi:hypothetical protein